MIVVIVVTWAFSSGGVITNCGTLVVKGRCRGRL